MSTGSENTAQDLGDRLRATEGRFMMTAVADVESVAATGSTGTIQLSLLDNEPKYLVGCVIQKKNHF